MTAGTIAILILLALEVVLNLVKHGESKGEYNFWMGLIDVGTWLFLLYWAGNFD